MRESVVEREVCAFAIGRGWLVRKLKWIGRCNAPDRFFARDGRVVFVEFKAPDKPARRGQEKEIKRLHKAGIETLVIDSIEFGREFFT